MTGCYRLVKGNAFARAGLEMACWDALAGAGKPLHALLGGTRPRSSPASAWASRADTETLFDRIDQFLGEGYRRIKLKIGPGQDIDVVRRVRQRYPAIPLQVDANSAYTLDDLATLKAARCLRPAADRTAAGAR